MYLFKWYLKMDGIWKWFASILHISPSCEPGFHPPGMFFFLWTWFPSIEHLWWIVKRNSICLLMETKMAKNLWTFLQQIALSYLQHYVKKIHWKSIQMTYCKFFIFHHSGRLKSWWGCCHGCFCLGVVRALVLLVVVGSCCYYYFCMCWCWGLWWWWC